MERSGKGEGIIKTADRRVRRGNRIKQCIVLITALSAAVLSGCSLAQEEAGAQNPQEDRLVGVFVTTQHPDNGVPEMVMRPDGKIVIKENREGIPGRLIFEETSLQDVVFEGMDGYGIYSIQVQDENLGGNCFYGISDDVFSDIYWETGDKDLIETTIYVSREGPDCFYFNPVYQTEQGDIYLQPGNGVAYAEKTEGASFTHTLSWDRKVTGKDQESVTGSSFTVHITFAELPAAYRLLFFQEDNSADKVLTGKELLSMEESGQWELKIPEETAYLILEQESGQGEITRTLCNRGDGSLEFLKSLGGGILVKQQIGLLWE